MNVRLNRASSLVTLVRNGLLPRHETGMPGEAIFRLHPRANPPLSVLWYSTDTGEYHKNNSHVRKCISASPEMVPKSPCRMPHGVLGRPKFGSGGPTTLPGEALWVPQ